MTWQDIGTERDARGQETALRMLDVMAAGLLLVLALPVLAVCAVAIRLDSAGPILFRQKRVGRGGRPFELLKLRTMVPDADPAAHRAHVGRLLKRRSGPAWAKLPVDPRVTRVGRVLRRTGMDELPQLVNVLWGQMSLVGPRPALAYEMALWQDWHRARLAVRPGMTGLWQVDGWGHTSFDEMVRQDLAYIDRRGVRLNLVILMRTPAALWRHWANQEPDPNLRPVGGD